MKKSEGVTTFKCLPVGAALMLLTACSSVNLWPFGGGEDTGRSRVPENATAYKCDGDKNLYVRYLNSGESAWVILPERQFRLDKASAGAGVRYTNGSAVLETKSGEVSLTDGPSVAFTNCKAGGSAKS
jgi:membrane-bound inhibitor of C-type lysozyme